MEASECLGATPAVRSAHHFGPMYVPGTFFSGAPEFRGGKLYVDLTQKLSGPISFFLVDPLTW